MNYPDDYAPLKERWNGMMARCYNPKATGYKHWGGRGIDVCDEWRTSPISFIEWSLANGFALDLQLDRTDNDRGYSPSNCRWVSAAKNCDNRRTSRKVDAFGESKTISEWAEDPRCNAPAYILRNRVCSGWSSEKAISEISGAPISRAKRNFTFHLPTALVTEVFETASKTKTSLSGYVELAVREKLERDKK